MPKGREASTQRRNWCLARRKFCSDDDVDCGQFVLGEPECLANLAPYAISCDGIAGGLDCHRKANPGMAKSIRLYAQSKIAIVDSTAAGVDRIELQFAAQTQLWTKT